jgi:hypothetical protein
MRIKGKCKVIVYLTKHHAMKTRKGVELNGQLRARGHWSRYPLDRRLDGSQSRSGRGGEEKHPIIALAGK